MSNTLKLASIAILTALALVTLSVSQIQNTAFAAPEPKVTICHDPPGEDDPATPEIEGGTPHTITIGPKAAVKHLENHEGDTIGPCPPVLPPV